MRFHLSKYMKNKVNKSIILFFIGAISYGLVELFWRGYTHTSMLIVGGMMFLVIGGINEYLPWDLPLETQCLIGAIAVTATEFVVGLILNVWLGLGIWDYSNMAGNIMGQICPIFSLAWIALSFVAILLDDYIRYKLWNEKRPKYISIISTIFGKE